MLPDRLDLPPDFARRGIRLVFLFGSQASGRARPDSDVDIAAVVDERMARTPVEREAVLDDLGCWLAELLAMPRDLVDIEDVDDMPLASRVDLLEKGRCLYEAEPGLRTAFYVRAVGEYQDFQPTEDFFREVVRRRLTEGSFGR
ncbi:MAG: nucleotidyltransferase domain-containing protein [Candidatus Eremiobacterota bacterium]